MREDAKIADEMIGRFETVDVDDLGGKHGRVGVQGKGESVWLAFFLCDVLRQFAGVAHARSDAAMAQRCAEQAARLQASYDRLEERVAELAAQEDLARVRPDLDGNRIMELLGIPAGPQVGEAWRYLKELRLDRGPLTDDEAVAELLAWWRSRGNG